MPITLFLKWKKTLLKWKTSDYLKWQINLFNNFFCHLLIIIKILFLEIAGTWTLWFYYNWRWNCWMCIGKSTLRNKRVESKNILCIEVLISDYFPLKLNFKRKRHFNFLILFLILLLQSDRNPLSTFVWKLKY